VLKNVIQRGEQAKRRLTEIGDRHPEVLDVRGSGLMWGIELADPGSGEPRGDWARGVQRRCLEHGLILEVGGRADGVIRLLPPLVVTEEVLDAALDIIDRALAETLSAPGPAAA